ncbi:MAG TPA: 6-bladed beta-propeller [Solirubrobacterales bacterium]|nr:6-bladed beta-propeller [Solirubrobacterales bacterium]
MEVFEQLRSPESPEQYSFALSLPAGASLQESEGGGAEVLSSSEDKIEEVPPPSAVDAQGAEVSVTMSVEGDSLVLEVPHKSREVAYPILVDPEFLTDSPSFGIPGEWTPSSNGDYTLTNMGSSLSAVSKGHVKYGANTHGQWVYVAPGQTTYIKQATFSGIYFYINNIKCNNSQPHGYTGLYNVNSQQYIGLGGYAGTNISNFRFETPSIGSQETRDAVIGIGTADKAIELECAHEFYIGGVTVVETDPEAPTINSVSGVPSGWFDPAKAGTTTITATDPGLGLEELAVGDGEVTNTNLQHCSGLSGNRCPRQLTWNIHPAYVEGEHTLKVSAEDALAITSHVANWSTPTKVDTKAPDVVLDGQLAVVTKEQGTDKEAAERPQSAGDDELSLPVYNLEIKATDGDEKGDATKRQSGVKNIEVFLDGSKKEVSWKAQGCTQAQSSCKMEEIYQLKLVGLSAGKHKLKVIATDQVGLAREREIEFEYIPATGMNDEYVMQHFPLPDGEGNESEEEDPKRPELAVDIMNGNLVYRQRDVEIPGTVNLELERFYNSQLPDEENTEWGDGWTLAQTPKLEPEETKEKAPPKKASMVRVSGAMARSVALPTEPHAVHFSSKLGATVTKEPGGGYAVADQSGKTANSLAFNEAGRVTALRTPGYAKVEYGYENGDLSEVAVHDPASLRTVSTKKEPKGTGEYEAPAYFGSYGGESSGSGKLSRPGGVAIDPEGNVWVADAGHSRVQEFNSEGEFLGQFGAGGASDGLFSSPHGIAIDSKGNLWVTDSVSSRVQEFNSKGEFIRKFGSYGTGNGKFNALQGIAVDPEGHVWAVNSAALKSRVQEFSSEGAYMSQFGTSGSADGQLKEPQGIATDAKGNLWIADTGNNRIEEFNSKGEFIRKFGSVGSGNGQLKSPSALAFDPEGNAWVTDAGNNRIEEFSSEGVYLSQLGTAGNNSGQFSEPQGIATDSKGNLWIADTGNDRVQESTVSEFVRKFGGEGSEGGQLSHPSDAAIDPKGNVWVLDDWHNRVQEFGPEGKFIGEFGAKGTSDGLLLEPSGLAVDSEGNVWVADAGNYRVQEFNPKGEFVRKSGSKGTGNGKFTGLEDVAVDPEGRVWAIDQTNTVSRVEEFNSKGEYLAKFGNVGTGNGQFSHPHSIVADAKGNLWVADSVNYRVQEFNSKFEFIRKFGSGYGFGNGQFKEMRSIAVGPEGNVWVADAENNRIQEFSGEGAYLGQFGTAGNNDGEFIWPEGVAVDTKGNVWVVDSQNNRVQEIAASEFIRKFGGGNSGAGQLSNPEGVAVDSEGNVWAADSGHNRIQEFDAQGRFIRQFGAGGASDGLFSSPQGIAIDSEDNIWVADSGNHRLQEFNSEGKFIGKFGSKGTEGGQFESLEDVAIDAKGNFWTVDSGLARVQEFTAEGKFLAQFGSKGIEKSQLESPEGITIDPDGNVWVTDSNDELYSSRIEEFTPKGEFIRTFGSQGTGTGQFKNPSDLTFDSEGNLWVVDSINDRIQVFSAEGTYLGKFGTPGANEGQFDTPKGIAIDGEGNVWIADRANDRLQRWQIPRYALVHSSIYASSFAGSGNAGGEFKHPGGVALDSEDRLWIADEQNNRIEEFDTEGEFVEAFGKEVNETAVEAGGSETEKNLCTAVSGDACQAGKAGSAKGALSRPASLALDAKGNVFVADAGNSRIEEFDSEGKYLSQFGSQGSGKGQFLEPEGIAIDPHGNIWVSDTYNGRVQEFDETGAFIKVVSSYGFDPGQMGEPTGIAIGPGGNVWIADWEDNRVEEFSEKGKFVRQFGTEGAANGQFHHPDGIAIDDRGELWVADEGNRVQAFTEQGEYVAQFGAKGSGEGQFSLGYPIGVADDSNGNLWIADSNNDRMQHWGVYNYVPADEGATVEDTPEVEVNESSGLVASVEGEEAGQTTYSHKGELLSAVDGPKGKTTYEYDEAKHLTKVTLPNGTWGKIQYDSIGRVKSVTVSLEGKEKTTHFEYTNESRRTVVEAEGEPTVTYDIGADGSVLKWWDAPSVPTIEEMEGSLYAQRVEVNPEETITPGDQTLVIPAYSVHGIASIQLVANGNQLITEKTCKQDYEVEGTECEHEELSWVTESENWPPGILQLEVVATDSEGHTSSERFADNVPYVPPPDPEVPEPPKFAEVLHFRERTGLDLDLKGNERAINERIFQLIADWHDPSTPEGEVARATRERWGVPLRAADAAELEYREQYMNYDFSLIEEWGETHASTFAGYIVDESAGGIIRIGFTSNPTGYLAELKQQVPLIAQDRLASQTAPTGHSLASLQQLVAEISSAVENKPNISALVVSTAIDIGRDLVRVGGPNTAQLAANLQSLFGANSPIAVEYAPGGIRLSGERLMAGENLRTRYYEEERGYTEFVNCTAGYGAFRKIRQSNGSWVRIDFLLTAGHCSEVGQPVQKYKYPHGTDNYFGIGHVSKSSWQGWHKWETDALAVKMEGLTAPDRIFWQGSPPASRQVTPLGRSHPGDELCFSGVVSNFPKCGEAHEIEERAAIYEHGVQHGHQWKIPISVGCEPGDSGSPVWDRTTGRVVGLLVEKESSRNFPDVWNTTTACYATPLVNPKGVSTGQAPGVFGAPAFEGLHLSEAQ